MRSGKVWGAIALTLCLLCFLPWRADASARSKLEKAQQKVDTAKTELQNAQKALKEAEDNYKNRGVEYLKGAPGFYRWVVQKYAGTDQQWKADDAAEALKFYDTSEFKSYTKVGEESDASSLENMINTLDLFTALQTVRDHDEYHPNLPPVYTSGLAMAVGQIHANASLVTGKHMLNDSGYYEAFLENLAWGYATRNITDTHSAFSGWYYAEKENYKARYDYVNTHFPNGILYNTVEYDEYTYLPDTDGSKEKVLKEYEEFSKKQGEIGHYATCCMWASSVTDFTGDNAITYDGVSYGRVYYDPYDAVIAGFGISDYCTAMEIDECTDTVHAYKPAEFRSLFMEYYNSVYPASEKEAFEAARDRAEEAAVDLEEAESNLSRIKEYYSEELKEEEEEKEEKEEKETSETAKAGETDKAGEAAATEKAILKQKGDKDAKNSTFHLLQAKGTSSKPSAVKLTWKKPAGAKSYTVYGAPCGQKMKKLTTVKKTSLNVTKLDSVPLTKGTYYKFVVTAQRGADGTGKTVAVSKVIHAATTGGKVTNPKKVTVSKKKVTVKAGKTIKVKAKQKQAGKKTLKLKKHRAICFESQNPAIATVNAKGQIRGVAKGKTTIYAYAQNGVFQKIAVTVK